MYNCPDCGCCCDHERECCAEFHGGNTDHLASEAAANGLTPALSPQSSASALLFLRRLPFASAAAPSFDFSALGDLSQQATEADQQFDLHYGAAQDEYLISCIYLARIHALTAKRAGMAAVHGQSGMRARG